MSFEISNKVDSSKVFLTPKSEMKGRWDPFYYQPELIAVENKLRNVTSKTLRDFTLRMAGGATPSKKDADIHYTESSTGIPFIRVQNLSTSGQLSLEDCKHISLNTHNTLLSRSKLSGGELLVKITGVGRMAIASVVPEGFEGNINQHIVTIQTEDMETSKALAAYLNLDVAERLASRRATGGTRPALDYPALLSLPVILDTCIPKLLNVAYRKKGNSETKAHELLASIDDVLLNELGITPQPESTNTIEERIFYVPFSGATGQRFDPHFHHPRYAQILSSIEDVNCVSLGDIIKMSHESWDQESIFKDSFPYLEIGEVNLDFGCVGTPSITPIIEAASRAKMLVRPGDLLVSLTRPTRRAIAFAPDNLDLAVASNGFAIIREVDLSVVTPRYLFHVLRSRLSTAQLEQRSSGGNYPAITVEQLLKILIPLPKKKTPAQVSALLDQRYAQAEEMLGQATLELDQAKHEIESLILGQDQ